MSRTQNSRRAGLTLIELLVLLSLLLFLFGLLIPAVFRVRTAADRTQSINNLKQMALELQIVDNSYKALPPTVGQFPANSKSQGTLHFYLLPFIGQDKLYKLAEGNVWNNGVYSRQISTFVNPEDKSAPPGSQFESWLATTSYAGNWLVFKQGGASFLRTFLDGMSNTIVFTERYQVCNGQPTGWGYASLYYWAPMFAYYSKAKFQVLPTQEECRPALAQATSRSGIQIGLGDGSVRMLTSAVSPQTWMYACDPADGMVLGPDFGQ